jgi:AcrR family transcriptional regulator
MNTLTRKQREIQERETKILDVARQMLTAGGYLGLNMDAIAAQLEYSKGTIYNHFSCKEEIIIALAIETMDKRSEMMQRAASYRGLPRERMAGIGVAAELFVRLYPSHFRVEQLIRSASIWEKTSENRRQVMHGCESRCMGIVAGIVRDGVAQGHLELPDGMTPEDLVFGLWSQTFGAYSIIATSDSLTALGVADPYRAVRRNVNFTLDGYGWTPLSSETDYLELFERLQTEVFPNECREILAV